MIPVAAAPRSTAATTPFVVVEDHGVVVQTLQPIERGRAPFQGDDRADQRQEIGVGRRNRDLSFPFRLGQIEQGGGQRRLLNHAGIERQHVFARQNADPIAGGPAVLRGHVGQRRRSDFRQQPLLRQQLEFGRVLGEENVGGGRRSFLHELAGQLRTFAGMNLDVDPCFLGERLGQQVDGLLMLRGIERQRRGERSRKDSSDA